MREEERKIRRLEATPDPVKIVPMTGKDTVSVALDQLSDSATALARRIHAKIERGDRLTHEYAEAARAYYRTNPWRIAAFEDPGTNRRRYVLDRLDPIPLQLETLVADALGNYREALDHIAYQLELQAAGREPSHKVYFPIAGNATSYPAQRDNNLRHVPAEVKGAIDAFQPYRDGAGHALWQLTKLKTPDKHHLLVATALSEQGVDISATIRAEIAKTDPKRAALIPPLFIREVGAEPVAPGSELYSEPLDVATSEKRNFIFALSFNRPDVIDPSERATTALNRFGRVTFDVFTKLVDFLE